MVSVRFVRMWAGFNPHDNPLLAVLRQSLSLDLEIRQELRAKVDIEVASVYPSRRTSYVNMAKAAWSRAAQSFIDPRTRFLDPPKSSNAKLGIWYTPENVRPPASGWDVTLSFEPTGWTPNNVYFPFWQLGTDLFGGKHSGFLGQTLQTRDLITDRVVNTAARRKFCCAFVRNPHPTRMRVLDALRTIGPVDVFGLSGTGPIPNKMDVAQQYRFILCFENDLYPGYVTEKPFDAWASAAVPLWWGLPGSTPLNRSAIINLSDYSTLDGFLEHVSQVDSDKARLNFICSQRLLRSTPDRDSVIRVVRESYRAVG